MITVTLAKQTNYDNQPAEDMYFELYGLSTDTKPTETYQGVAIRNTSVFYEMNTGKLYMYDADNKQWLEQ